MAIAFDNAIAQNWNAGKSGNTLTAAKTNTGSDLILFVGVSTYNGTLVTVSGVTYNGVALTKVNSITAAVESNNQDTELWYLDAPATGANDIVATLSAEPSFGRIAASSFTGKTSSGIDAAATAQNTAGTSTDSPVCNVNVVEDDCWQVGYFFSRRSGNHGAGTATTIRAQSVEGHAIADSNAVVGTGNQTLALTSADSVTWPGVCSASFSEAGGGGGGGDPEGGLVGGKLVRGGLLMRGVLVG